jgi:hypothetical protein
MVSGKTMVFNSCRIKALTFLMKQKNRYNPLTKIEQLYRFYDPILWSRAVVSSLPSNTFYTAL